MGLQLSIYLPGIYDALGLMPSTAKKKKKELMILSFKNYYF
jgi:hypothetical protein